MDYAKILNILGRFVQFEKKDITLSLEKGYLTISADKKECSDKKETYLRRERNHMKRLDISEDILTEEIKNAEYYTDEEILNKKI